tara:strand:+ start:39 stop:476 length:438 start_codon:yes stop_codon:yes gene_type:complete
MIIICPSCEKKFEINQNLIPKEGRLLQCGFCDEKWFFKKKLIIEKNIVLKKKRKTVETNVPEFTEDIIKEAEEAISKDIKQPKNENNVNILSSLLVFCITFVAIIILADTFKNVINSFIPGFDIILDNLYESLKDIILFFEDLFK